MVHLVLLLVACVGLTGCAAYLMLVCVAAARFRRRASSATRQLATSNPPITLLKPLYGIEPGLLQNLESFFLQDYPSFEIVFGARNDGFSCSHSGARMAELET
jgi:ceramide glucosyltransferase